MPATLDGVLITMNTIAPWLQRLSPVLAVALLWLMPLPGQAQSIQGATDNTGTAVVQAGAHYTIQGGSLSSDGANLFHSFSRFGLNAGEVANFLATPAIQNILGRVTGGEASVIDGRIQVTGSNANLFLLNPAGMVFGSNASLSVPASFTATTATGIGFGNSSWFHAAGTNDYPALVGSPHSFAFTAPTGTLVNAGHLTVGQGHSITLLGSQVINTGTLTAPDGSITLAAVPAENLVRLRQPNSLLSLEFTPLSTVTAASPLSPVALPQLLTGGNVGSATGLTVNPNGTVSLTQSGLVVTTSAGTAIATGTLTTAGTTGGAVTVVGDRVTVSNALINAAGTNGGGTVRIGGDFQGQNTLPAATETTLTADSTVRADALTNGNGGRVIVWADQTANIHGTLSARGGAIAGNGGLIETSGKQLLNLTSLPNASAPNGAAGTWLIDPTNLTIVPATMGTLPANTINVGNINAALAANTNVTITTNIGGTEAGNIVQNAGATMIKSTPGTATLTLDAANDIVLNDQIRTTGEMMAERPMLMLVMNAGRNITTSSINTGGGNLTLNSANGAINTRNPSPGTTGLTLVRSEGGAIAMSARGNITADSIYSYSVFGNLGQPVPRDPITLTSTGGAITVDSATTAGGSVTMTALGDIAVNSISTYFYGQMGTGNVTLTSTGGAINTRNQSLTRSGPGWIGTGGGSIMLSATGNITTDDLSTVPWLRSATNGAITLTSTGGAIDTRRTFVTELPRTTGIYSRSGAITITAAGDITAGIIDASVSTPGIDGRLAKGGDVHLVTPGNILVSHISTEGLASGVTSTGNVGGSITVDAGGFFRATDIFTAQNNIAASISSAGTSGGGAISITHGGKGTVPFMVGDASVNGTVGAITSGTSTILPTQRFWGSATVGNVSILTTTTTTPAIANACVLTGCQVAERAIAPMLLPAVKIKTVTEAQAILRRVQQMTGVNPALIYLGFTPTGTTINEAFQTYEAAFTSDIARSLGTENISNFLTVSQPDSELELFLVTATGEPLRKRIPGLTQARLVQVAQQFRQEVSDPARIPTQSYLPLAQQLYTWIIKPLDRELTTRSIQNVSFIADPELRSIPFAALHDGTNFLIDKYSLGLMTSLSLVDSRYVDIRHTPVLLVGSSTTNAGSAQAAIPRELVAISQLWPSGSKVLQGNQLTLQALQTARQQQGFAIIHLATSGERFPDHPHDSYIQLGHTRFRLDQLRGLSLNHPPVELMVFSHMTVASHESTSGLAGLALQAGSKSALAPLWDSSDAATVPLITAFYHSLTQTPIKAEALRQAQLAMRHGQVSMLDGKVVHIATTGALALDVPNPSQTIAHPNLTHPYYWASFTLLGSPW